MSTAIIGVGIAPPRSRKIDLARRPTEAIWHMLTRNQPFAPKGATNPWPPDG